MAKVSEEEKDALRQAAEAAGPILSRLREERADLDERITRFESIIAAYEAVLGKRPRKSAGEDTCGQKPRRGEVAKHIDAILQGGGDYDEPEIRKLIAQRFQVAYPRATVYTALRRGKDAGRYEQKERRWRLKVA